MLTLVQLVECPGGTGDMQAKLKAGEIDVCIGESSPERCSGLLTDLAFLALTDALIAGIANGQTSYKIVGRYISTPLRWSVLVCEMSDRGGLLIGSIRAGLSLPVKTASITE
jgi:hypothetical protein